MPALDNKYDILIVEDSEEIAALLKFMLEREGFSIKIAIDGNEASRLIELESAPDLVLMDMMLPFKNGLQLISEIRKSKGWQKIPVIVLSAKSKADDIAQALDTGADDYVVKPFQPKELLARIRRNLARYHAV